jgi:hypothetical protein
MKLHKLVFISFVSMLGSVPLASAQLANPQETGGGTAAVMPTPQGQCWDTLTNTIRTKSGSASGARTPGGVTTGSTPSGQANNDRDAGIVAAARPPAAANLPVC